MPTTYSRLLAFCRFSIVLVMLSVCAGNITNSVLLKWGFREDQKFDPAHDFSHGYSLVGMMNGDAPKPYVYRSSLAKGAKWIAQQLSPEAREQLFRSIVHFDSLRKAYFQDAPDEFWTPEVAIAYHLIYAAIVLSMLFALLLVHRLARLHGLTFGQAAGFLAAFSFVYPLTFQRGGYYFDFIELLGALAACYCVLKGRMFICTLVVAVFSLNKETFFLVPLALFFLPDAKATLPNRLGWTVVQLAICAVTRHVIMSGYEANAGGIVEFHLWDNLKFWIDPRSWFTFDNLVGRGIFTPRLENPLILVPLAVFFRAAWRASPALYRRYFLAAFLPVLPLFLLFGFRDEARSFTTVFPAIVLIALHGATRFGEIFGGGCRDGEIDMPGNKCEESSATTALRKNKK